jgi:hypothetical protein
MFIGLLFGAVIYLTAPSSHHLANIVLPLSLIVAMAYGNYIMATRSVATLLTPIFAFRTAILFYGGLGSLMPIIANESELSAMLSFYPFTDSELLKYNIVILLFAFIFLLSGPLIQNFVNYGRIFYHYKKKMIIDKSNFSMFWVGFTLFTVGTIVSFIFIIPFQFGFISTTFPVMIFQVALSAQIGLFLMLISAFKTYRPLIYPIIGAGVFYIFLGILTFSKSDAILPLIMIITALVYARPSFKNFTVGALIILAFFQSIQPITAYGRHRIAQTYGTISAAMGPEERIGILRDYYNSPAEAYETDVNYALLRFSYVNVGTLVMSRYDIGQTGNSYEYAYALLIPRLLWPAKPSLTESARTLNFEVTGNDQSSVTSGLAPEGYWNGGWFGVALAALMTSIVFWLWSLYALRVQAAGAWHLFPVILVGIRAGTRFDGWFVVDILGPLLFAVVGHFLLSFANRLIHRLRGP